MKKWLLLAVCSLFLGTVLCAQNYEGARVAVLPVGLVNTDTTESFLQNVVEAKLKANLDKYARFIIIDVENDTELRRLQKQSQTGAFDRNTAIEAGRMLHERYVVFSSVVKDGSKYNLSCTFTDIQTGVTRPAVVNGIKTTEELYVVAGCAVDKITIDLCERLGIYLSSTDKHVLQYGEGELSDADRLKRSQEDEEYWQGKMAEHDAEIRQLSSSTDLSAVAVKNRAEAEKARAEENFRRAKERNAALLEEAAQRAADAMADAERDATQKAKRDERERQADKKKQEVRSKKMEGSPLLTQMKVIEATKKALVEIRSYIEDDVADSNAELKAELLEELDKIENRAWRATDKGRDGKPTEEAMQAREEEKQNKKNEYYGKMSDAEKKIRDSQKKHEEDFLSEIKADYTTIAKKHTLTSYNEKDLKYLIGTYDGKNNVWPVTLYMYSDGEPLAKQSFDLEYTAISGKKIPKRGTAAYAEYEDDVDLWISLFNRKSDVLVFEVDYSAKPKPEDLPSEYTVNYSEIRVKDAVSEKVCKKITPPVLSSDFSFVEKYDVRDLKKIEEAEQKKLAAEEAAYQKKLADAEKERQKQQAAKERERKKAERWRAARSLYEPGYKAAVGWDADGLCVDAEVYFPFGGLFTGFSAGTFSTPKEVVSVIKSSMMSTFGWSVGYSFTSGSPRVYLLGSLGGVFGTTRGKWMSPTSVSNGEVLKYGESSSASYFKMGAAAGLELLLSDPLALFVQVDFTHTFDAGNKFAVKAGVAVHSLSFFY